MLPSARRVLLVEEGSHRDPAVAEIANALETAGYSVRVAEPDDSPNDVAACYRPDIAVISLAPGDGPRQPGVGAVARQLEQDHGVPVVVVAAQAAEPVPVPSEPSEAGAVVSRLSSVLHEVEPGPSRSLQAGDVVVDEAGRVALRADEPLDLTRLEFDLLAHFVRNRGRVLTREALLSSVWANEPVTSNAVEAVVSKLRAKLEARGRRIIHTVRGVGYVLRVEGTSPFDAHRPARERRARRRSQGTLSRDG
jgi:DNA-binding response OmpR family regulator